jgi:predicted nucleic acid-binding protein
LSKLWVNKFIAVVAVKIYIETSIPSFYFDTRPGVKMKARREWTREWWAKAKHYESRLISYAVLAELDNTPGPKRESALELVKTLPVLEADEAVEETVQFYLEHKLMPEGTFGDAVHLALASLHKCDFLLTWNCKHLANANKFDHIRRINGLLGLATPNLVTPLELLGNLYE